MREYKIYLPLKYNDGKNIEVEKLRQVKAELVDAFWSGHGQFLIVPVPGNLEIQWSRVH